jgi:CheY-like chemotaxis protein
LRVLVVDDNVDAVEVLKEGLENAGHTVVTALDGPSAIAAAADAAPHVAVLDIGLPGMDGYELARRLRRSFPLLRLVALTGYGQRSDVDAAIRAGFDAHCTKPITIKMLLEQIERRRTMVA